MKLYGRAMMYSTAMIRHNQTSILRNLGCLGLIIDGVELPSYYDPQYQCEMEILAFDSDHPVPKYVDRIDECQERLANIPIICAPSLVPDCVMSS